ncbi:transmembrane amino acid transporter protein-domain-containing protein [Dichotomocladium elegans]|nr:transmembrane amino acid transporter protein-domain-containing protein [Dichotomocladium elegans]
MLVERTPSYHQGELSSPGFVPLSRHATVASVISQQLKGPDDGDAQVNDHVVFVPIKSTFVQSVFNAMNVLIGVGILAFPLAFRYAGWLLGSLIFVFCAVGTNYTAKLLARSLDASPGALTYGDMGMAAFGERGRTFIGGVFFVEIATMAVAMITLLGDGLQALYPMDHVTSRLLCFCLMTPFEFLPLRKLSAASLFGIVSCVSLVVIVLYDGFSKTEQPGSIWNPMPTEILPSDPSKIPLSFGLMMAGFAGHAVFPAIYRDMDQPKRYNEMVDITYVLTAGTYVIMAVAGYIMFGSQTMQEVPITQGFAKALNSIALWLVVITPIAKFALMIHPLHVAWELYVEGQPVVERWMDQAWKQNAFQLTSRIILTAIAVYIAIVFPGFDRVMSLLGSLFSFGISIIFPLMCYQRLYNASISLPRSCLHLCMLALSICMAVTGTAWSFLSP